MDEDTPAEAGGEPPERAEPNPGLYAEASPDDEGDAFVSEIV